MFNCPHAPTVRYISSAALSFNILRGNYKKMLLVRRRVRLLLNYLPLQQLQREKNAMKLITRAFVNHAHQRSASFKYMKI